MPWGIRAFAVGGAIAAASCVVEEDEIDVDETAAHQDDEGMDDAPADESASHTTAVESETGDDEPPAMRRRPECDQPITDACAAYADREVECDTPPDDRIDCLAVLDLLPQTAACCIDLAALLECVVAAPCGPNDCLDGELLPGCG